MGEFKHIAVNAAEEEDLIIEAGLKRSEAQGPAVSDEPEQLEKSEPNEPNEPSEPNASKASSAPSESSISTISNVSSAPTSSGTSSGSRKPSGPTTLEDLQSGPMPAAQKIVIIAALVCIIGALVYCLAFMR